jgi:large subunit ribosomal protein L33
MAKKDQREMVAMACTVCKAHNYITKRNKINTPEKLVMSKYCRQCRKHTQHKETNKLD